MNSFFSPWLFPASRDLHTPPLEAPKRSDWCFHYHLTPHVGTSASLRAQTPPASLIYERLWIIRLHLANSGCSAHLMSLSLITPAEPLLFLKATYSQVLGIKMWALLCCVLSLFSSVPLFVVLWTLPARLLCPGDSPGQNTGVGGHALLQAIFPTQESNPHLLCLLRSQVGSLPLVSPGEAQLKVTST